MNNVAPARSAAFKVLLGVDRGAGHSDELLHQPDVEKLSSQDRNLAMNLVMGTLRWQVALDARIAMLLAKPKAQLDPSVRIALRLGAFQILHLDRVPVYAAIGESVELAKSAGNKFAAGMVNAVLRKIATQPKHREADSIANADDLAQVYAHPRWLVDRWVRNYGLENAKSICEYDQQPAPTFVRLLTPDAERELQSEGVELMPGNFLVNVRSVIRGDIFSTNALRKGWVRILDEGSQLIAELAGHGGRILDACAAPGGKTSVLAERNPKASIVASDVSKKRLNEMERLIRLPAQRIEYVTADAANQRWKPEFDLILCDVPCSGTGTIARNPEIRHRFKEEDLNRQSERQKAILSALMRGVERGGRLLYSTCSLEPEENEAVIHECLQRQEELELAPIQHELERLQAAGILGEEGTKKLRETAVVNGCLRTLPGVHGCDGFFAALFVRRN